MTGTLAVRVVAALLAVVAGLAQAQPSTTVLPSPTQRCLTRGDLILGTPAYPQEAFEQKAKGRVVVELEFLAPDAAPRLIKLDVDPVDRSAHARLFEQSVRDFVAAYRVPCLPVGDKASLRQEFVFVPHDLRGITWMASEDEGQLRTQKLRTCLRHVDPKAKPDYPMNDLRSERQGTAVVRLRFADARSAPAVTVLEQGEGRFFGETAQGHALGYRLPCHDGAEAVELLQLYVFKIEDGRRVTLKDVPLVTLLGSLKGIRSANVYFDFNTMGCPFDVHFSPMQPHAPNHVGEIGRSNPERRFFLDWLRRQELDVQPHQRNALLGQDATITVPCTVLNLHTSVGGSASK